MLFVDAVVVKVRDGQVRSTPFYVIMGVTVNGEREILGIWAGDGGEGPRFWLQGFSATVGVGGGRGVVLTGPKWVKSLASASQRDAG